MQKEHNSATLNNRTDSIYVYRRDSIIIQQRGDTVFFDRWKTAYKFQLKTDTLIKTDTFYVEKSVFKTETTQVEKQLNWWQKTLMWSGVIFIVLFVYAIYTTIKKIKTYATNEKSKRLF